MRNTDFFKYDDRLTGLYFVIQKNNIYLVHDVEEQSELKVHFRYVSDNFSGALHPKFLHTLNKANFKRYYKKKNFRSFIGDCYSFLSLQQSSSQEKKEMPSDQMQIDYQMDVDFQEQDESFSKGDEEQNNESINNSKVVKTSLQSTIDVSGELNTSSNEIKPQSNIISVRPEVIFPGEDHNIFLQQRTTITRSFTTQDMANIKEIRNFADSCLIRLTYVSECLEFLMNLKNNLSALQKFDMIFNEEPIINSIHRKAVIKAFSIQSSRYIQQKKTSAVDIKIGVRLAYLICKFGISIKSTILKLGYKALRSGSFSEKEALFIAKRTNDDECFILPGLFVQLCRKYSITVVENRFIANNLAPTNICLICQKHITKFCDVHDTLAICGPPIFYMPALSSESIKECNEVANEDLARFLGQNWINDICISEYAELLRPLTQKIIYSSHVLTCNSDEFTINESLYVDSMFSKSCLFPVHRDGNHWALVYVDIATCKIEYFDGLSRPSRNLELLFKISYPKIYWFVFQEKTFQKQTNTFDCGILLLEIMRYICLNDVSPQGVDTRYLRYLFLSEILEKKIKTFY